MKNFTFVLALSLTSIAFATPTPSGTGTSLPQLFLDEPDDLAIELLPFDSASLALHLFETTPEDRAYLQRPPELTAYLEEPVIRPNFESRRILKEPRESLSEGTFISLALDSKQAFKNWKAQFIDGHGRLVKQMSGSGTPAEIKWDGTEDGWIRVRAGEPYNVVLTGQLVDGTSVRQAGRPIVFEAVRRETPEQTTLILAGDPLFSAGNTPTLTPKGEDRLLAAATIMAAHTNDPVTIDIFSKDTARAAKQQKLVVSMLADLLTRDPSELLSEIQVDPNEEEEIRVTILGFRK